MNYSLKHLAMSSEQMLHRSSLLKMVSVQKNSLKISLIYFRVPLVYLKPYEKLKTSLLDLFQGLVKNRL